MHIARAEPSYLARLTTKDSDGGFWTLHRMGLEPPTSAVLLEPLAYAYIGRAAWRVQCPFCQGSQFTAPGNDRFCCCDCGNTGAGWVKVEWPADLDEIETVLVQRRMPATMNWLPHEALEHLYAENIEHGLGTIDDVPKKRRRVVKALIEAHQEFAPAHVIAKGTFVHPDSEWHPGKAIEWLEACGQNFSEADVRLALMVYGGR